LFIQEPLKAGTHEELDPRTQSQSVDIQPGQTSVEPEALGDLCFHVPGCSLCCSGSGTFRHHQLNSGYLTIRPNCKAAGISIFPPQRWWEGLRYQSAIRYSDPGWTRVHSYRSLSFVALMGVNPNAVSHSLGEYAALQMSGVLSISDAIFLIGHRAHLLETRCQPYTHSMLAVSGTLAVLRPLHFLRG
jgi:hypothetical protein